jgi:outer membrane protein OmpA-like peptidoglycan-associated protein
MERAKRLRNLWVVVSCVAVAGYGAFAAAQTAFNPAKAIALSLQISDQVSQIRSQLTSPPDLLAHDLRELEGHADHLRRGLADGNDQEITTAGVEKAIVGLALGANEQAKAASLSPAQLQSFAALEASVVKLEEAYGVDVAAPAPKPPPPTVAAADPCKQKVQLTGIEFATDSDVLTSASDATLKTAIDKLKKCEAIAVKVDGYTDSTGPAKFNLQLSQKRADAVKAYLVQNGIAASRLSAKGDGEADPIASNATMAGRAENRRVELTPAT